MNWTCISHSCLALISALRIELTNFRVILKIIVEMVPIWTMQVFIFCFGWHLTCTEDVTQLSDGIVRFCDLHLKWSILMVTKRWVCISRRFGYYCTIYIYIYDYSCVALVFILIHDYIQFISPYSIYTSQQELISCMTSKSWQSI